MVIDIEPFLLFIWTALMSKASRSKIPIQSGREMIVSNKEKVNRDVVHGLSLYKEHFYLNYLHYFREKYSIYY